MIPLGWKKANRYNQLSILIGAYEKEKSVIKDDLTILSEGKNCQGAGVTLTKVERKGGIDYSSIPELKDIDLEKYRKKSSEYIQIKTKG